MPRGTRGTKIDHTHSWKSGFNDSEMLCTCGYIMISPQEKIRREVVWDKFMDEMKATDAFNDYFEMGYYYQLWIKNHNSEDLEKVKEIDKRVAKRGRVVVLEDGEEIFESGSSIKRPPFPDPRTWTKYIVPNTK